MIKLAIRDDDINQVELVKKHIKTFFSKLDVRVQIEVFQNPNSLTNSIYKKGVYDIYILDILMPEMTGIKLGELIRSFSDYGEILYLTGSENFALDAFKVHAAAYILKPINYDILASELTRIMTTIKRKENKVFHFKSSQGNQVLSYSDIMYLEISNHIIELYLSNSESIKSNTLRVSMDSFIEPLLKDERFKKPHKSFLINFDYIKKLTTTDIIMQNNRIIPIAKSQYGNFKKAYMLYTINT